jgi:hypothetical protein
MCRFFPARQIVGLFFIPSPIFFHLLKLLVQKQGIDRPLFMPGPLAIMQMEPGKPDLTSIFIEDNPAMLR